MYSYDAILILNCIYIISHHIRTIAIILLTIIMVSQDEAILILLNYVVPALVGFCAVCAVAFMWVLGFGKL